MNGPQRTAVSRKRLTTEMGRKGLYDHPINETDMKYTDERKDERTDRQTDRRTISKSYSRQAVTSLCETTRLVY